MENLNLKISGMSCDACVAHVTKALEAVEGVSKANVDLANASASVTGSDLDISKLAAAVKDEGYEAQSA